MPDKRQENYRIRRYKIYFYLEDDTIQVNEPELKNSGMPQGTCLKQSRASCLTPTFIYCLSSFLKAAVYCLGV